ncbi:CAMK/CAMKL/Kin4 protein kinase [Amanita rubescens]|nr:CAMK/CAMKL/Kin4 protein kinase [Amanita rubescens]
MSLQPEPPGPSRLPRPVSVAAHPPRRHQRASQQDDQPAHIDVYAHPAAVAYAAAHPRRQIPKFGPYLLLQTLGEGEFGKVKLGLHTTWGEEVAVKLIRRGNVDSALRMSKIEREIEVLRILKHPNIVRLYDVIETDKYIGIILEYASGGELFDHILAHRYLRERDAAKLFSQLISGVWYIHQKKIVHRDLKLENLLLDRNRNVIITDFGFANRFEHRADDLMQTSCGSPCYAAPELVISEGLYVGSAVDIWSCGVILYAMLAGYLPFDDDPANPDGDNINLLYKYIVSTPLSFPDYISPEARNLLSIMLVPDPDPHPWLAAYAIPNDGSEVPKAFGKAVEDLERAAMEQHQQKRLAYQKQMKALAAQSAPQDARANRSLSYRPADHAPVAGASGRSKSSQPTQSEYIYQSDQSVVHSTPAHADRTYGSPSASIGVADDDPFAESKAPEPASATLQVQNKGHHHKASTSPGESNSFRHTIQPKQGRRSEDKERKTNGKPHSANGVSEPAQKPTKERRSSSSKPLPPPPINAPTSYHLPSSKENTPETTPTKRTDTTPRGATRIPIVNVASPPDTPAKVTSQEASEESGSQRSVSSKKGHKKGVSSLDKIGLTKIFGGGSNANAEASSPHADRLSDGSNGPSGRAPSNHSSALLSPTESEKEKDSGKKGRRNTLTLMVEPIISRTMRNRSGKGRATLTPVTAEGPSAASFAGDSGSAKAKLQKEKEKEERSKTARVTQVEAPYTPPDIEPVSPGLQASSSKARKVMQWFRTKSKGARDSIGPDSTTEGDEKMYASPNPVIDAASPVQVFVTTPAASVPLTPAPKPQRTASTAGESMLSTPSLVKRFRNSVTIATSTPLSSGGGNKNGTMRIHHGAVDQAMVTTRPPAEVMKHVRELLEGMGVEIQIESEYKFKCIRAKRKKGTVGGGMGSVGGGNSLAAVTMVGSAASNGVDKRGLPLPSQSTFSATGGMLRGLLMRRQSVAFDEETSVVVSEPLVFSETAYGDVSVDAGGEVRFSVELTRIDRLKGTYSLEVRRLKGNLNSYGYLYETFRQRTDLQR